MMSRLPYAGVDTVSDGRPPGSAASGPPVVVLAGVYPMTGVANNRVAASIIGPAGRLVGAGRRVYVINRFPNIPDDITMSDFARIHADAFATYFDGPVDLIGCSTGGSIAQQIASEHPDVVRRLVLASTGYTLPEPARQEQAAVADQIAAGDIRSAASSFFSELLPAPLRSPGGLAARLLAHKIFPSHQAALDLAATLRAEDAFDISRYPTITAPTLIVGGADDAYYPTEMFERTAELIPGSMLHIEPGRGHVAALGDAHIQQIVLTFLS